VQRVDTNVLVALFLESSPFFEAAQALYQRDNHWRTETHALVELTKALTRYVRLGTGMAGGVEMGLFPAVLYEANSEGIHLAPKYIPAEVFDKRVKVIDIFGNDTMVLVPVSVG
jgi:predicted nucleic acid-binding protein